jgi:hypothetical protein
MHEVQVDEETAADHPNDYQVIDYHRQQQKGGASYPL